MNEKDKEFLLDTVKHINKCYRDYYYEMTIRGLPLEVNSFAKGLEKALMYIIENNIAIKRPVKPDLPSSGTYTPGNEPYTFTGNSVGTE